MIFKLALRSLLVHPIRSAVLACGFGFGVSVMAILLGVGEVILVQARSPALRGGGDVVVGGAAGQIGSARYVLSSVLGASPLKARVVAAAPRTRAALYLVRGDGRIVPVRARGGVPSLERALADPETAGVGAWTDAPGDTAWIAPDPSAVLRAMDRFHPVPDPRARAESWAEWLYFSGRAGDTRFYLTYLVGPARPGNRRIAGVRLQLDRGGRLSSFADGQDIEERALLAEAPDLAIGRNRVRLDGLRYRLTVDLPPDKSTVHRTGRLTGELFVEAVSGRSMPPITIRGAGGWQSGFVVPVMSGTLGGFIEVDRTRIVLDGGTAYHDHNWGHWQGVTWQWGQVEHDGLSFVYGRVHPPADAADSERIPGFLAAFGPDGPIGYSADVRIEETNDQQTGRPRRIVVHGRGPSLDLRIEQSVDDAIVTSMPKASFGSGMDFVQLRARYRVTGNAGGRRIDFEAPGSAETFRGKRARDL